MKFCVALISLLLCCSFILAQEQPCPDVCLTIFKPVCGVAVVDGQTKRCQFSNACRMSVNGCVNKISWSETSCGYNTPNCT